MNKLKNILVAVDFSPASKAALSQAVRLARWNGARLNVLHGVDEMDIAEAASAMGKPKCVFEELALSGAQVAMKNLLRQAGAPRGTQAQVLRGAPIDLILRQSSMANADLIVMGIHSSSEEGLGAGILATRVLRKSDMKVLLVEPHQSRPFKNIVACIDFSETAREVVTQARHMAERDDAQISFIHVFLAPWRRFGFRSASPAESRRFASEFQKRKMNQLREFVGEAGSCRERFALIDADKVGQGIAGHVRKVRADLIVVGRRGRSELGYLMMGSTVERLARELDCSMLAVRRVGPVSTFARSIP